MDILIAVDKYSRIENSILLNIIYLIFALNIVLSIFNTSIKYYYIIYYSNVTLKIIIIL